jgi:hypothetical protein
MADYYEVSGPSGAGYPAGTSVPAIMCVLYPQLDSGSWYVHADLNGDTGNWARLSGGPYASQADALDVIYRLTHDIDPGTLA